MGTSKIAIWMAALVLPMADTGAGPLPPGPRAGDTYELQINRESSQKSSDEMGSSGSSTDRDTMLERVIAVRDYGLELEYDLPRDVSAEDRARQWQFPARVFKPSAGPMQLLNRSDMEARLEGWLKAGKLTREACGHWYFTWNAFQIECDPQLVLETIGAFDLRSVELRDGAFYQEKGATGPARMVKTVAGSDTIRYSTELKIDPEAVRHQRADSDVVVGEIMKKPMTLEAALQKRAGETVTGTIEIVFETDASGDVRQRRRVTNYQVKEASGAVETNVITETLSRRLIN